MLITAAHCTDGVRGKVLVNFEPVAPAPPVAADDPGDLTSQTGFTGAQGPWLAGTPHAHPLWANKLQLNDLHDVGVVVLDTPRPAAPYPQLPARNYLANAGQRPRRSGQADLHAGRLRRLLHQAG